MRKFNWQLWAGLVISVVAFFSYPSVFVNWETTRDFPWANLLLFAVAVVLLIIGVRRAFAPGGRRISKILAAVIGTFSVLILAMFVFVAFIESRRLPASERAPQIGQQAPEFTLNDMNNKPTTLAELRAAPINGSAPKGVLLVFYRGYW